MKVSAVFAVYNATWCVERALDSVLGQTVPPDEILVCDDGSTDGTPELIESSFGSAVTVLRLPHRNASAARADGLARARGDWLAFVDADDTWLPHKLEAQLEYLARHPEVRHVSSDGVYVSSDRVLRESWLSDYFDPVRELNGDLLALLVERCFVLMSSVMVEARAYREVGGIDPKMIYSHDYDLWMRIAARHPMAVMPDRLITYFSSPNALSKRYEARHRDNLELMSRVERGELRADPALMRRGSRRAADLAYDLGVLCLRDGRAAEARPYLRRAMQEGPATRRILSAAGAMLPAWAFGPLSRLSWLRGRVHRSREVFGHIGSSDMARDER